MAISHARDLGRPFMNLIRVEKVPILKQLHLEERLLRTSSDNWCIINDGTDTSTIVMGLSGKPSELLELESVLQDRIPVIKRFSGGGTVIVDDGTVFVSFICNKGVIPGLKSEPRAIMSWSGQFYGEALRGIDDFHLRENDYAFGNRKFGGNAQSITKDRWIHHTSFLWDYDVKNMDYLKLPKRAPNYRSARHHGDFLCSVKEFLPSRSAFMEKTIASIGNHFLVRPIQFDDMADSSNTIYPRSTRLLTKEELEESFASQVENTRVCELQS